MRQHWPDLGSRLGRWSLCEELRVNIVLFISTIKAAAVNIRSSRQNPKGSLIRIQSGLGWGLGALRCVSVFQLERETSLSPQKSSYAQDQQLLSAGFSKIAWRRDNKADFARVCRLGTIKGFWCRPPGSTNSTNRQKLASPSSLTSPPRERVGGFFLI